MDERLQEIARILDEGMREIEEAENRLRARLKEYGINLDSPKYDPKPKQRKKRADAGKPRAKREEEPVERLRLKNPRSLSVLKAAGYVAIGQLNGASKKRLAQIKWLGGDKAVAVIEKALKKRGMSLAD